MDPFIGSSLISAGSSLIGGLLGNKSADDTAQANREHEVRFAKNQIRWKTLDAERAGLHPLFALGSSAVSPSPAPTGNYMGNAISQAGADISRGLTQSHAAKRDAVADQQTSQLHTLQMEESKARSTKDFAQAALYASEVKRSEQRANTIQDSISRSKVGEITFPGGYKLPGAPGSGTEAQKVSDKYGDVVGEAHGITQYILDLLNVPYQAQKKYTTPQKRHQKPKYKKSASQYRNVYR